MEATTRSSLVSLLQEYRDVFTFGPEEMPDIDPVMMEHRLKCGSSPQASDSEETAHGP